MRPNIAATPTGAGALRIDGAQQLGSGTLVRLAVALSGITGRPIEIVNARAQVFLW